MGNRITTAIYIVVMVGVIIATDFLFFKGRFGERLAVNIGIVLVFATFYFKALKRS